MIENIPERSEKVVTQYSSYHSKILRHDTNTLYFGNLSVHLPGWQGVNWDSGHVTFPNWGPNGAYGEGNGTPLQYSCLENPMDRGAWWAAVHGVAEGRAWLSWLHFQFSRSCIGEGNGNPLQCSCLENPRDGGAWWAAVYWVAQSQTRLKRLSSSSSRELRSHMLQGN